MTDLEQLARTELVEAVERISAAMMGMVPGSIEIVEEPYAGGLIATQTRVTCSYNDLRIVLAAYDKAAFRDAQPGEGARYAALGQTSSAMSGARWYIWKSGEGKNYVGGHIASQQDAHAIADELNRLSVLSKPRPDREAVARIIAERFARRDWLSMPTDTDKRHLMKAAKLIPPVTDDELTIEGAFEAADAILALPSEEGWREERERLRAALKPFADKARQFSQQGDGHVRIGIDFAHFRNALAALSNPSQSLSRGEVAPGDAQVEQG